MGKLIKFKKPQPVAAPKSVAATDAALIESLGKLFSDKEIKQLKKELQQEEDDDSETNGNR